ncbi:MAG: hypothetical protein AAF677_02225 [Pseudomonadota bacterium]
MPRLGLAFAIALGAAPFAHADDTTNALARCASIAQDTARLACFDRLAGATVIEVFAGKGGGMTDLFTVEKPRLLHFESSDVIMVATLLRADDTVAQNLHMGGRGTGRHLIVEPGAYRLQVNASGAWRVWLTRPAE